MKKTIQTLLVILTTLPLVSLAVTENNKEYIEYEIFKAKTEANLESLKALKTQELLQLQAQIDNQKNILEQINHQIDSFGNNLTVGSTIITILLLLIGFFSYRNAKTDAQLAAKNEAQNIAQQEVKTWFDKNTNYLNEEIELVRKKLKELEDEVSKIAASTTAQIDKHLKDVLNRSISKGDNKIDSISYEEQTVLNAKVEELKLIAEAMYKFQDWNTKAFAAYHQKDFNNAVKFWDYASKSSDATETEIVQSYLNKAVVLEQLQQFEMAIKIYDRLIQEFSDNKAADIQLLMARTYNNKGFTQGEALNQPEAAIETYSNLIKEFNDSKDPLIQQQVIRAHNNIGATQAQRLNQPKLALDTYEIVIKNFDDAEDPIVQSEVIRVYLSKGNTQIRLLENLEAAIQTHESIIQKFSGSEHVPVQEQVANAYNSHGFSNLLIAKKSWKIKAKREKHLNIALNSFERGIKSCNLKSRPMILGNLAYCNWLLNKKTDVKTQLHEALSHGGKNLYEATIKDTEEHTVAADKAFKALVEDVWLSITNQS